MSILYSPRQTIKVFSGFGNEPFSNFAKSSIELIDKFGGKITRISLEVYNGSISVRDSNYIGFEGVSSLEGAFVRAFFEELKNDKVAIDSSGLILKESEIALNIEPLGVIYCRHPNLLKRLVCLGYSDSRVDISTDMSSGRDPRETAEELAEFFW